MVAVHVPELVGHEHVRGAAEVFQRTLAEPLERVFRESEAYAPYAEIKAFAEYLGPGSFAGLHHAGEEKELRLFDVQLAGYGFVGPERFVADFGHLPIPRVVYRGKLTGQFTEDVRLGRFGVAEGVVCKGGEGGDDVWMVKIKTDAYKERLQQAMADRWEDYWE